MSDAEINTAKPAGTLTRFRGPIWTLLLLAPFVAELLSGSTRTSVLFVYIPEVMVWGIGALWCRELARRWRAGGASLLALGLALSVAEEFIIQQTSLAPLPFPGSHPGYGRIWGVNLVYFLAMLGFESVWVVVVPVQLTELFFPKRARKTWLHLRGFIGSCIAFLVGSFGAWYGWTQKARLQLHAAPYHPPVRMIVLGILLIAGLIAMAYLSRGLGQPKPDDRRRTVPVWLAGVVAFVMGCGWWELMGQNFVAKPVQPFWIAVFGGLAWAVLAFALLVWWSSRAAWDRVHGFAAAAGATLACMCAAYLSIASFSRIDVIGEVVFDVLALTGLGLLAKKVFAERRAARSR